MSDNVAFHNLPASAFPFDIYAYPENSPLDVDPVWHQHVTGPAALRIPGIDETGVRVRLVVRFADGTETRSTQ